jgi:hypothetical protein
MTGGQDEERSNDREQTSDGWNDPSVAYFHRNFETVKHLTTLSAGSIVLIGTFLQDIFPKGPGGELAVGAFTKWLIAGSFILFGASLIAASFFMYLFTGGDVLFPLKVDRQEMAREFPDDVLSHYDVDMRMTLYKLKRLVEAGERTRTWVRWAFFLPFI